MSRPVLPLCLQCLRCNKDQVENRRKCSVCRRHREFLCNNIHRSSTEGSSTHINTTHHSSTQPRCQCTCKGPPGWVSRLLRLCRCTCRDLRALPCHRLRHLHLQGLRALPHNSSNINKLRRWRSPRAPVLHLLRPCKCPPQPKVHHFRASRSSCPSRQRRSFRRPRRQSSARISSIPP